YCRLPVAHELQSLLTGDDVELLFVLKRKCGGVAHTPIDFRVHLACQIDHCGAQIDTHHPIGATQTCPREPRNDARSTGDIEKAFSCRRGEVREHQLAKGTEKRTHES